MHCSLTSFLFLGKPGAPKTITVKESGKDFVSVEWSPPKSDGGSKLTGYRLLLREDGTEEWKEVGKAGGMDSNYTFKNLNDKKNYFFAVVAENKLGQSDRMETERSVKPKKPASMLACHHLKYFLIKTYIKKILITKHLSYS